MGVSIAILVTAFLANMLLGLTVFMRNPKNPINRSFFFFVCAISAWAIFNYTTDNVHSLFVSLWSARLANFFALLTLFCFWRFNSYFTNRNSQRKDRIRLWLLAAPAAISISPFAIRQVTSIDTAANEVIGPLYAFVVLYLIIAFFALAYDLIRGYRTARDILTKTNIRLIFLGTVFTFTLIVGTNIFLPIFLTSWKVSRLGPIFTLIFVASVAGGIIRNRLFDVRLIVARSVAYVLALGMVTGIFSLAIFGVSGALFDSQLSVTVQRIVFALLTVVLVLTYAPIKRFFDRITNRLFYRDAYVPQILLDELNTTLVTTIELQKLLAASSRVIIKHLKSEFCSFAISQKDSKEIRLLGSSRDIPIADLRMIQERLSLHKGRVLLATSLTKRDQSLQEVMESNSLMAVSRLSSHSGTIGYMMLGGKKSGNIYSSEDAKIIDILGDELAIAVQNSLRFEEIQQFNMTLQAKVEQATKQLRQANTRLKELDQTKDEFISMASHQLRTPLTTIKGYLSMVLEGDVGPLSKNEKQMIQQAFDSAERMVFLIADLLNVSRLQSGKFIIDNKPTDLVKMVDAQVSQLKETAANHRLTLTFKKPEKFPTLNLDETKIQQVVMNFMDNAIYYTPAGGSIEVALTATDKEIAYTVTDTGLGVPKNEQHHLFAKFYRAGNARKMRPDGTGLGLFMAKKVIVAQGGAIIFKSTEGKGSTFGFSFPLAKVRV